MTSSGDITRWHFHHLPWSQLVTSPILASPNYIIKGHHDITSVDIVYHDINKWHHEVTTRHQQCWHCLRWHHRMSSSSGTRTSPVLMSAYDSMYHLCWHHQAMFRCMLDTWHDDVIDSAAIMLSISWNQEDNVTAFKVLDNLKGI